MQIKKHWLNILKIMGKISNMPQSISTLPSINISDGECMLSIENGEPNSMYNDYKNKKYGSLPVFIVDTLTDYDQEFFSDYEEHYHIMADYCAEKIEEDGEILESVISIYISDVGYTRKNTLGLVRSDPALRQHKSTFDALMMGNDFWERMYKKINVVKNGTNVKEYLVDMFRESDSFAELRGKLVNVETKSRMERFEEECWDAIRYTLNEYIRQKNQKK